MSKDAAKKREAPPSFPNRLMLSVSDRQLDLISHAMRVSGISFRESFMRAAVMEKVAATLGVKPHELDGFKIP